MKDYFTKIERIFQDCRIHTPSDIDFYNEPIEDCLQELTVLDLDFIDFDFPPIEVKKSKNAINLIFLLFF